MDGWPLIGRGTLRKEKPLFTCTQIKVNLLACGKTRLCISSECIYFINKIQDEVIHGWRKRRKKNDSSFEMRGSITFLGLP